MFSVRKLSFLAVFWAAVVPSGWGQLIDPLDTAANFSTPLNASYTVGGGEVSILSQAPSVDRVADWMRTGTVRLDLIDEGAVYVEPTAQVAGGEWGLWALFFESSGAFAGEVNVLPFTDSVGAESFLMTDFAPVDAESYFLRFRVREGVGEGFTFTQINATPVPEPSAFLLFVASLVSVVRRRRRGND